MAEVDRDASRERHDLLAERFEEHRAHLRAVAYRMLGSPSEADDAVQEAWLRLSRADADDVENLRGWLTTVVARVCLDMLRSRTSRREEPLEADVPDPIVDRARTASRPRAGGDAGRLRRPRAAGRARHAGAGRAARVRAARHVRACRSTRSRPIVDRTPGRRPPARQPGPPAGAGRGRRRPSADLARQREVVDAFLAASRGGDFDGLLAVLDPDVVLRADAAAVRMGGAGEVRGSAAVASFFSGKAQGAVPAFVDGAPGAVVLVDGRTRLVLSFVVADRILGIEVVADPEQIAGLDLVVG